MRNRSLPSLPLSCTGFNFYWLNEVNRSISNFRNWGWGDKNLRLLSYMNHSFRLHHNNYVSSWWLFMVIVLMVSRRLQLHDGLVWLHARRQGSPLASSNQPPEMELLLWEGKWTIKSFSQFLTGMYSLKLSKWKNTLGEKYVRNMESNYMGN